MLAVHIQPSYSNYRKLKIRSLSKVHITQDYRRLWDNGFGAGRSFGSAACELGGVTQNIFPSRRSFTRRWNCSTSTSGNMAQMVHG